MYSNMYRGCKDALLDDINKFLITLPNFVNSVKNENLSIS